MNLTSYIRSYECPQKTVEGAMKLFEMCKDMDFVVQGKVGMGTVDKTIKDSEDVYIESLPMLPIMSLVWIIMSSTLKNLVKIILTVYTWVTTN